MELHASILERLCQLQSDVQLQLQLNVDGAPRRGAFEVAISKTATNDAKQRTSLWSGVKLTPRAAKFPTVERLFDEICAVLELTEKQKTTTDEQHKHENKQKEEKKEKVEEQQQQQTKKKSTTTTTTATTTKPTTSKATISRSTKKTKK